MLVILINLFETEAKLLSRNSTPTKVCRILDTISVSPFRLKNFFTYKGNKANLDPFHMCFTISLWNFTSLFLLLFAYFRYKFFSSLHLSNFRFEAKQGEAKFKSIFLVFSLFSLFFALNFSLRFDLVIFASKQNKAKRNSSIFFRFFRFFSLFFAFFAIFSLFLRLIFVSLRFVHIIFAYFTFVFASDFWCFASKWIVWNQVFFSLPSETKFSLQFQISLPKRKWGRTLDTMLTKDHSYNLQIDGWPCKLYGDLLSPHHDRQE